MINNRSKLVYIFVVMLLIFTTLACGSSTTQKMEEAAAPPVVEEVEEVATAVQPDAQKESSETTAIEPTLVPESTEAPTLTPEPTTPPPTSTPEPEPISVIAQGFGQNRQSVGYAFIVENPNATLAFEDSQYQIAAMDESGAIVATDSGYITLLLPEQKLGFGNSLYVEEGVAVSSIEIQLNAGNSRSTDPIPNFTVEQPTYFADDFFPKVSGVIQSPYSRDFADIRVSAVLYNENDEIIGGGFTFVNFILANSLTGVEVSVDSSGEVARVELYPVISTLSLLSSENEIPEGATSINLAKYGFGQDGGSVGFGLLVENPNPTHSVESSAYRLTFFSEDGTVIGTDEGYINLLLPEQTLGIGGEVYVAENQVVSRIEAQLKIGEFVEVTEELPPFSSENVVFSPGSFSSKVSGFILNPYPQNATFLDVSALAFDEDGEIIGGGSTFLDFAAANNKSAIEVTITTSGTPATVSLYATTSSLTQFE